jgi:hypothetical protein
MISVEDSSPIKLAFKEKNVNVQEEFTTDIVTQCPTGDCKQCAGSYVNIAFRHRFICKCECHNHSRSNLTSASEPK